MKSERIKKNRVEIGVRNRRKLTEIQMDMRWPEMKYFMIYFLLTMNSELCGAPRGTFSSIFSNEIFPFVLLVWV